MSTSDKKPDTRSMLFVLLDKHHRFWLTEKRRT